MKFFKVFILLLILTNIYNCRSQEDTISYTKLAIFGVASVGVSAASFMYQTNEYWSDPADFHVMSWKNEYDDALFADKLGHFYSSYAIANIYSKMTEWTGINKENAAWIGFGMSFFHQTYIEIYDGFSDGRPYLGFSRGDFIANTLGASYSVAQHYYPYLNYFKPKISYFPFQSDTHPSVFNDYNNTNHWWSIDLAGILGADKSPIPGLFAIAVGHSVANINRYGSGVHQFYLGLDLNWNYFQQFDFVKESYYLQLIINILEKYKVPLPAIRLNNGIDAFLVR